MSEVQAGDLPEEIDPAVVELVSHIRDRFGLRGLRGAQALIQREITVAERALAQLSGE